MEEIYIKIDKMSSDWAEKAFIINTWNLIIQSYFWNIWAFIKFLDAFTGAPAVLITYLFLNALYHLAIFETLEVEAKRVMDLC